MTEEPGGLQSMESQRVEHGWMTNFHFQDMQIGKEEVRLYVYVGNMIVYVENSKQSTKNS